MRTSTGVVIALILAATGARARDVVYLRSGAALEGRIEKETSRHVTLRMHSGTTRISRDKVDYIERDEPLAAWEIEYRRKRAEREKALAEDLKRRLEEKKKAAAERDEGGGATPKEEARLRRLAEDLASDDADTRKEAKSLLEGEGKKAVPILTKTLLHRSIRARETAAILLGKANAKESVRVMLIALAGAVPDSKKVRFWQRGFVRALRNSIVKVTGQSFRLSLQAANQDKVVKKYVEWWEGPTVKGKDVPQGAYLKWDTPQVGEKKIAEDDPEREKKLWEARKIDGERASYPVPEGLSAGSVADQ